MSGAPRHDDTSAGRLRLADVDATTLAARGGETCLIHSGEHGLWWRAGRSGYTGDRAAAGQYTLADAHDATRGCGPEKRISFVKG